PPPIAPEALVQVTAPKWSPTPIVGRVVEARGDSVLVLVDPEAPAQGPVVRAVATVTPGPTVVAVPVACMTRLRTWESGSQVASATRGTFVGGIIGAAIGLLVTPEPTAWKLETLSLAIPATAVGTTVGAAIGWSRPGGQWVPASLGVQAVPAAAVCTPRAAPKKAPPKPAVAAKK
ncbi:MAG: YtxH domain-containing protein, partial [Gemmatimonadaceae bacterium]|nr:YtxH domain-containing protein [Gemmatimonadaceae bacterium]